MKNCIPFFFIKCFIPPLITYNLKNRLWKEDLWARMCSATLCYRRFIYFHGFMSISLTEKKKWKKKKEKEEKKVRENMKEEDMNSLWTQAGLGQKIFCNIIYLKTLCEHIPPGNMQMITYAHQCIRADENPLGAHNHYCWFCKRFVASLFCCFVFLMRKILIQPTAQH